MLVHAAKSLAQQWITTEGSKLPGFQGAFFHGSINWLENDVTFPPASDLDVMVVLSGPPAVKLGKFTYKGVLLEISYIGMNELQSAEQVLSTAHLAGSFHRPSIITDPTGHLTALQNRVMRDYTKERWVRARCAFSRDKVLTNLGSLDAAAPFHDQIMGWLFGTGVTTHVLLAAGLRNPTVRKRYVAVHELLEDYGRLDFHEELLAPLGCAALTPVDVSALVDRLAVVFDATAPVIQTPIFFASDLSADARRIAIDGSHELIAQGYHREAIFWIVATFARCMTVFSQDAPLLYTQFFPQFEQLMVTLGIHSFADLQQRATKMIEFLPEVWRVAEEILVENPAVIHQD